MKTPTMPLEHDWPCLAQRDLQSGKGLFKLHHLCAEDVFAVFDRGAPASLAAGADARPSASAL